MNIKRDFYLQQLIDRRENGMVKVICGLRRSGKSFLLFNLFKGYLLQDGVKENQIISLSLDEDVNDKYRDPAVLSEYIRSCMRDSREMYYLFLDEIQFAISREELGNNDKPVRLYGMLNGLMHLGNIDIYVTGSNSKMLSKDVLTEFRGRGDVVNVSPLSFREYYGYVGGDRVIAFEDYARYGGMPLCLSKKDEFAKSSYLIGLFDEVFHNELRHIKARALITVRIVLLRCSALEFEFYLLVLVKINGDSSGALADLIVARYRVDKAGRV